MSDKYTGGPAFPLSDPKTSSPAEYAATSGMTLRDYFAGQAIIAVCNRIQYDENAVVNPKYLARISYQLADAMLEARKS